MSAPFGDPPDPTLRALVDDLTDGLAAFFATADAVVAQLPVPTAAAVRAQLEVVRTGSHAALTDLTEIAWSFGDPDALRDAAAGWRRDVVGVVAPLAGLATLNGMQADDHWSGPAATAYRNTLPAQHVALVALVDIGNEIDAALTDMAGALNLFRYGVVAAVAVLVTAVIEAVVVASTGVGLPAAVKLLVTGLAAFAAFLGTAVLLLVQQVNDVAAGAAALERRLVGGTAFPGGTWPRSTTPVSSDAALLDGDDTDWTLAR